jgi:hypothetical protein
MKTTFLVIIITLGVAVPLTWLIGTVASMIYFYRHRERATQEEQTVLLHPELGFTMADGGDAIDKKQKDETAKE